MRKILRLHVCQQIPMRGFSGAVRSNPFSLRFRQGIVAKSVFLDQPGAFEHTHVFPKPSRTLRVARLRRQLRSHGYDKSEPVLPVKQLGVLHHPIPIHVRDARASHGKPSVTLLSRFASLSAVSRTSAGLRRAFARK